MENDVKNGNDRRHTSMARDEVDPNHIDRGHRTKYICKVILVLVFGFGFLFIPVYFVNSALMLALIP